MRATETALKVNSAVEKILEVLKEEGLNEEEIRDALKATEVTLGVKPPMPPMPPMPPFHGPEEMHIPPKHIADTRPPHLLNPKPMNAE